MSGTDPQSDYENYLDVAIDIENMKIRGAGKIARMGAYALRLFAEKYSNVEAVYYETLEKAAKVLYDTRPTAVSLENALLSVLNYVRPDEKLDIMLSDTIEGADIFIREALEARAGLTRFGASLIEEGYTVHTHCNSTAAIECILRAHNEGKTITVHSTESRPRYQGRITSRELADSGIKVKMLVDSAARLYMDDADIVVVGADTIASDGSLFNKVGTWQIALAANDAGVPFYTCAEIFKFSPRTRSGIETKIELRDPGEIAEPGDFPGVTILNPAFDRTPASLITGIITEQGIVDPGDVPAVIDRKFAGKKVVFFY